MNYSPIEFGVLSGMRCGDVVAPNGSVLPSQLDTLLGGPRQRIPAARRKEIRYEICSATYYY